MPPAGRRRLLDDVLLETLHEADHLALFRLRHAELRQGRRRVAEKRAPVALADAHSPMAERHVAAAVVPRSPCARAQEVDQQLLLPLDPVGPPMRPETAELRVAPKPGQQIVRHRRDGVVAAEALVQSLLLVAHGSGLPFPSVEARIVGRGTERNKPGASTRGKRVYSRGLGEPWARNFSARR